MLFCLEPVNSITGCASGIIPYRLPIASSSVSDERNCIRIQLVSARASQQQLHTMSSGSPKSPDATKNRFVPFNLWLVIALVVTNLLALYTFAVHPAAGSDRRYFLRQNDHLSNRLEVADLGSSTQNALVARLNETLENLHVTQRELIQVRQELSASLQQLEALSRGAEVSTKSKDGACECFISKKDDFPQADEFRRFIAAHELPLGFSPLLKTDTMTSPVGHACLMHRDDLEEYMQYKPGESCPDDEELTQKLLTGGCEPLPRRRCFARGPPGFTEPYPIPESFWTSPPDENILWTAHSCKSFECLNARKKMKVFADCLDCFDLQGREKERWSSSSGGLDLSVEDVLSLKRGSIRVGLDIGGGTGTFAIRMRAHNVTIVTTTLNFGGPFNNFIALRGVVPLYLTISQRFPFFDNTLDLVHSMHVLSNWIPTEMLEFILFDIDRVLRPGGLLWLDHFFCIEHQLSETYIPLIEKLGYKKLRWTVGNKLDRGAELKERYLTAVLEKPLRRQ